MAKIKIAHEGPLYWHGMVQAITSADYYRAEFFETSPEYFDHAVTSREKGRHVILSCHPSMDVNSFMQWILLLNPSEYVIPVDSGNVEDVVYEIRNWKSEDLTGSTIGVLAGDTYEELVWCYNEIAPYVDKIAVRATNEYFANVLYPKEDALISNARGRIDLLSMLANEDSILDQKDIHLLDVELPISLALYRNIKNVVSINTSEPIMWALQSGHYPRDLGLMKSKSYLTFTDTFDHKPCSSFVSDIKNASIRHNILKFREAINGN